MAFFSNLTNIVSSSLSNYSPAKLLSSPLFKSAEASAKDATSHLKDSELYFIEFSSNDELLGRIVLKVFDDAGAISEEFKELVTMKRGYGYKGSRVYAVCPGEWCLLGDLLYQRQPEVKEPEGALLPAWTTYHTGVEMEPFPEEDASLKPPPKVHNGFFAVSHSSQTRHESHSGSLISVASTLRGKNGGGEDESQWLFGPQFKVLLSEPTASSDSVFGQVISGISSLQKISEKATTNMEPSERVTIADCGILDVFWD